MERVCDLWVSEEFKFIEVASYKKVSFLQFVCIFFMNLLHRNINLLRWNFQFMNILLWEKNSLLQLHTATVRLNLKNL